ncbi:MAG: hypothetical protein M1834_004913 [Cirrosporium novae-zelandiae]|nr:MAG: hypothetical protein M1834_004913 [Cirrosporium novae-zelandiae]
MLSQCGLLRRQVLVGKTFVGGILQQTGRVLFSKSKRPSLVPIAHSLQPAWGYTFQTPENNSPRNSFEIHRGFQTYPALESNTPTALLRYGVAASYSAKGDGFDPSEDFYDFNTQYIPLENSRENRKDKKRWPSGEDAFFITAIDNSENDVAFGIADGVGGWNNSGIDPAHFSHTLCENMSKAVREIKAAKMADLKARDVIELGYQELVQGHSVLGGGSTACVGLARKSGKLEVANLGDSGYIQIRLNAVHQASKPQTHEFNTPYQLSLIPPQMRFQMALFGGSVLSDLPVDADVTNLQLQHGDVVVFATDGVWDNLNAQDILKIVSRQMTGLGAWKHGEHGITVADDLATMVSDGNMTRVGHTLQSLLAAVVTGEAKRASHNIKVDGPFAREYQKFRPQDHYHGGKVDDICVVVLVAVGH